MARRLPKLNALQPVELFFQYELAATRGDRCERARLADELRRRGYFVRHLPRREVRP